jgi:amino acid adenylation domain-containing protein
VRDKIEAIVNLSPMQEGMLFHTLSAPDEGVYIQQLVMRIAGELQIPIFEKAWSKVVARHQALRSAFVWESADKPLQVVFRDVPLPSRLEDWRAEPEPVRLQRWQELADADRVQGFALRRPPLFRLTFVRMGDRDYRFIFTYHHMLLDGWSGSIVFKEVLALYDALRRGRTVALPPAVGLDRYTEWAQNQKPGDPEAFFRAYLAGLRMPTPLYQDLRTARGVAPGAGLDARETRLSREQTAAINGFVRSNRLTLGTLFQGAWAAALSRYTGESEVLFGAVSSGRPADLAGMEQMVGMFINTMPARVRIGPEDRLLPWLAHLQRRMVELREHEHVPLVKIHPWSEITAGMPLFETCQVLENVAMDVTRPFSMVGLDFAMERYSARTSDPITFLVFPGEEVHLQLIFDRARIAPSTAERILDHLETWLEAAPEAADRLVAHLPMLTDRERRQLTVDWAGPTRAIPDARVHGLFAEQARRTPDAVAVRDERRSYTYWELDARADQMAQAVRALGVRRGARVGVCLRRSADMVAALLAVMKANAAYVPLDPAFPRARLEFMAEDAQLAALLAHEGCFERPPVPASQVLLVDRDAARIEGYRAEPLPDESRPDDVAYVLYTSGSTGRPKGVLVQHQALLNFLLGMQALPVVKPGDMLLAVTSLSFDIAGLELFSPLLAGAQVVVASQASVADGSALRDQVERSGATVLQATPATWRMLLAAGWQPKPSLRVLVGGEALRPDLARALAAGGNDVWNLYGPTETTIWSTAWSVDAEAAEIAVGRPIDNTQIYVVDGQGQLVPPGVVGEILIGGAGVALGYLNRPELTAERFVALPAVGSARVYRTGDLGRWREDGTLVMLSRNDAQVKIRGHRIELGEIEAALSAEPLVRHAAVSVVDDVAGDPAIVAYIVADMARAKGQASELAREQGDDWQRAWDDAYEGSGERPASPIDPTFDTRGWSSSYDAKPIPADQMGEWLEATVARVRSLQPRRILEVGCGTGMLLFRLARSCEAYVGADFSRRGLANIAAHLGLLGESSRHVTLVQSDAADLSGVPDGSVDTAVLNSVLQYFPSVAYAMIVLERIVQKVGPKGSVFVGDVRDRALHAALWTSVHLFNAEPRTTGPELRERVERSLAHERELLLDRAFFGALPGRMPRIASARLLLKRGRAESEMTRFRHDVVLRLDDPERAGDEPAPSRSDDWSGSRMALGDLRAALSGGRRSAWRVHGIPNARVLPFVLASRWLRKEGYEGTAQALRREVAARAAGAVHPEDVWQMAEANGMSAELTPSAAGEELFDALFAPRSEAARSARPSGRNQAERPESETAKPWSEYGNNPLQARLGSAVVPVLRRALSEKLPSAMVPSTFVFLDALPLTPNGKVDRRALPRPERGAAARGRTHLPPRDGLELQLARIWEEVMGVSAIGVHDDFFELGGHSIMAVRLMAQIEKHLGKKLPLSALASARTVEAQARLLRSERTRGEDEVLVCMQVGGEKPPLFCVHPAGGDVLCYYELCRELGPDYPIFAFEAARDATGAVRDRTVTAMACAYVKAMRQAQPKGPYRLAGWSLGGLVAAEMAEMLRSASEVVAFVGLLDTVARRPDAAPGLALDIPQCALAFMRYFEQYFRRPLHVDRDEVLRREGDALVAYLGERMRAAEILPPDVDLAYCRTLFGVYLDHTNAYFDHVPSRYSGRMTLMRAQVPMPPELADARMPRESRTLGWEAYCCAPLDVIDVPGDHISMLAPGPVRELAEKLRNALDASRDRF